MDCIFCQIAEGTLPAKVVYRRDGIVAFQDIAPQAPKHIVIIPEKHIATLNELGDEDRDLMGSITLAAKDIAAELGLSQEGYRLVMNCNRHGGQTVYHIHCHLLGGRAMHWPPG